MPSAVGTAVPVFGGFGLEMDGQRMDFVDSVEGGHATADVIRDRQGTIQQKHVGGIKYDDIVVTCVAGISQNFYESIKGTLDRKSPRHNGAIIAYDVNGREYRRLAFMNALITEIAFPELDAASRNVAKLRVKLSPEVTRMQTLGETSTASRQATAGKPRSWLSSNFRLQIAGVDCTRVSKVEAIIVSQMTVQTQTGESREFERDPGYVDLSNIVVTLPESDAKDFYDWHESFVIRGINSSSDEKDGTLEFLGSNFQALFTLNLKNLGIFRLSPERMEASTRNIPSVTASMYCQDLSLSYRSDTVASMPAQTTQTASALAEAGQMPLAAAAQQVPPVLPSLRFRS